MFPPHFVGTVIGKRITDVFILHGIYTTSPPPPSSLVPPPQVKNSWGPDWGMDGYILLKREAAQEGGECGILEQASYPVLV